MNLSIETQQPEPPQMLVVLRQGPHGNSLLRDGLDVALVAAAFGRCVSLVFMGEGVMALCRDQGTGALGQKGTAATLEMLELYDINSLWVESAAMSRFGLLHSDLMLPAAPLSAQELATMIATVPLVLTF